MQARDTLHSAGYLRAQAELNRLGVTGGIITGGGMESTSLLGLRGAYRAANRLLCRKLSNEVNSSNHG